MRSVFSRIALTLRKIHLGGASSGMRSTICPKSIPPLDDHRFARSAAPVIAPPTIKSFFILHTSFGSPCSIPPRTGGCQRAELPAQQTADLTAGAAQESALMPGLLPQPGGFEGLGSLPIGPDPGDSAAAHGPNQCDALVHGKTAAPTPATDP